MRPLCIYHGGCDDGFGAAWAVRRALGFDVDFHPGVYQQDPPDVADRNVVMVDFSYKRPVLDAMAARARSILILDHHKTAAEDLIGFPTPPLSWGGYDRLIAQAGCVHAMFDMNRSGAGMAWDFFHPDSERPEFIDYIEDRDLWRRSLPFGDEFTMCLRSYPQDFNTWDQLFARGVQSMIDEGRAIKRYYRLRVEELKAHAYPTNLGGVPCWISNAPYFAASEVAGELCDAAGADFGACYFEVTKGEFQYSLRSRGDFDVSAIAKKFGGGGHKNAAGFKTVGVVHEVHTIPAFLAKDAPLP
jgi:oligoribonuclease NrnB/cAMP/cGMP phosphodiesterase (DHH superfamily)